MEKNVSCLFTKVANTVDLRRSSNVKMSHTSASSCNSKIDALLRRTVFCSARRWLLSLYCCACTETMMHAIAAMKEKRFDNIFILVRLSGAIDFLCNPKLWCRKGTVEMFKRYIQQLSIPCRYERWSFLNNWKCHCTTYLCMWVKSLKVRTCAMIDTFIMLACASID